MSTRKPLVEGCTGGIWCEVEGHVEAIPHNQGTTYRHVKLTRGQRKTLMERNRNRNRDFPLESGMDEDQWDEEDWREFQEGSNLEPSATNP